MKDCSLVNSFAILMEAVVEPVEEEVLTTRRTFGDGGVGLRFLAKRCRP